MRMKVQMMVGIVLLGFVFVFLPLLYGKRPLLPEEREFLDPLFQESVDLDRVRIKEGGPLTWIYPGVTTGNTISFPVGAYDVTDIKDQTLLVHEMVHVWQFQHYGLGYIPRSLWETFTQKNTYTVFYDSEKSFRDYDVEEQAEIVAEYFLTQEPKFAPYVEELQKKKRPARRVR